MPHRPYKTGKGHSKGSIISFTFPCVALECYLYCYIPYRCSGFLILSDLYSYSQFNQNPFTQIMRLIHVLLHYRTVISIRVTSWLLYSLCWLAYGRQKVFNSYFTVNIINLLETERNKNMKSTTLGGLFDQVGSFFFFANWRWQS